MASASSSSEPASSIAYVLVRSSHSAASSLARCAGARCRGGAFSMGYSLVAFLQSTGGQCERSSLGGCGISEQFLKLLPPVEFICALGTMDGLDRWADHRNRIAGCPAVK